MPQHIRSKTSTAQYCSVPVCMRSTVIIGGSVAGFSVAAGLREAGYTGTVTIIDPHETALDRPPLSTEYLVDDDVDLALAPPEWFQEHSVTWVQDTAISFEIGRASCRERVWV